MPAVGIEGPANPAVTAVFLRIEAGGLPDRHAAEVRAVWVRIADAGNRRELPGLQQFVERPQLRMQADGVGELYRVFRVDL